MTHASESPDSRGESSDDWLDKRVKLAGAVLFAASLLLGLGALGSFLASTTLPTGSTPYWSLRRVAFGLAFAGLPLLLASVVVLLPARPRTILAAALGVAVCGGTLAVFLVHYPAQWGMQHRTVTTRVVTSYAIGLGILVAATAVGLRTKQREPPDAETMDESESTHASEIDETLETSAPAAEKSGGDDIGNLHQRLIAAPSIHVETDAAQVADQWTKTLFVSGFPDTALAGMLDDALAFPDIDFEYSIHVRPRDVSKTIDTLEDSIRDLEVQRAQKTESGDVTQLRTEKTLEEHTAVYEELLEGSQGVFDVSVYVTVRADEREAVERAAERLHTNLQSAQLRPTTASCRQADGLVCTSPVGRDVLDHSVTMLGGAVGCLFPFSMGTHIEDDGVLLGYHTLTESPVVVDRFARETGYNCVVMGNTGAGKTFNTVLTLLRRLAKDEDTLVFVADPFGDLDVLTNITGGERVTVSGSRALNPLEITPTPPEVLAENPDLDPYKQTVQMDAIGFLEAFFAMEGISMEGKRGLLSVALNEAYKRQGITPDPTTHDNPSPTLRDVRTVLRDIADSPLEYVDAAAEAVSDTEVELWRQRASQLRMDLAPFREGGEYEHLGRPTEINLGNSDVVYLDMQQLEGGQKTGVMMQLLLHAVYERAKQTDKRAIFAIDEAHYLMQTGANLEFLERAVRHARHYDLSLQFITQTVDEFFSDDYAQAAKTIADNCSLKIFHQVSGLSTEDAAEWLDLSPPEARFVRTARPGSEEHGYSQALVEIGDIGRFPVNVRALSEEATLITGDNAALVRDDRAEHELASESHPSLARDGGPVPDRSSSTGLREANPERVTRIWKQMRSSEFRRLFNTVDSIEFSNEAGAGDTLVERSGDGGDRDDR
jgi:hypothetical protein